MKDANSFIKIKLKMRKSINILTILGTVACLVFLAIFISGCVKEGPVQTEMNPPTVLTLVPAGNATSVAVGSAVLVSFSEVMDASTINSENFTLKQGTTAVAGTVTYTGTTGTFTPSVLLAAGTVYTVTLTTGAKDAAGNAMTGNFSSNFTTAVLKDIIPPTVLTVVPANTATSVAANGAVTVNFSEAMNSSTITSATFTLKQGTTAVAGTVTYSGTAATFTPTSVLANNTVYTATITTGAQDVAGNAIAGNYTWSFTTATSVVTDVTPPTVLTINPASSATSVALNSAVTAAFSETMTASTITSVTFTLSQGTTAVAGTVTYSGTTATFTPSSSLTGGTVYTATISTGVKDAAGNAIAAAKVWSFTTLTAVASGLSFASDVVPVLNMCNNCHTHGWTTSSVASTFYANLVNKGYVNATTYTSAKIYTKINGGHPGSNNISTANTDKIITWMKEGSKNN